MAVGLEAYLRAGTASTAGVVRTVSRGLQWEQGCAVEEAWNERMLPQGVAFLEYFCAIKCSERPNSVSHG